MGKGKGRYKKKAKTFATQSPVEDVQPTNLGPVVQRPNFNWESIPVPEGNQYVNAFADETQAQIDQWIDKLFSTVSENPDYKQYIEEQLKAVVFQVPTLENPNNVVGLYEFYQSNPNVAPITETWKPTVTNGQYTGMGFKVGNAKGKRLWGGDDGIYKANPQLQQNLPRGVVIVRKPSGDLALAVFAYRKFFGKSVGDEDDSDITSESIREGKFSKFLVSIKANGENCQISVCPFDHDVWIIGSKNKKIAVKTADQIDEYAKESGYSFATEMAHEFFRVYNRLSPEKQAELKQLLLLTRWTLNFEFENPKHQHIVQLTEEKLVLIGCSGIHVPQGKSTHPILGCAIARYFNFHSVLEDLTTYNKDQLNDTCQNIVRGWNVEGAVLILLDDKSNVVDFVKVKAWWYVLLRAIREKIRSVKSRENKQHTTTLMVKRLRILQNSMGIASDFIDCFIGLGIKFIDWLCQKFPGGGKEAPTYVVDNYPVLWNQFLTINNLPLDATILKGSQGEIPKEFTSIEESRSSLPLLILLQGIPGIGKSTVAKRLAERLNELKISTLDIAQDDFAHLGQKNSGKACLDFIRNALKERKYKCILLARNNANIQQYSQYVALDSVEGLCKATFLVPDELITRLNDILYVSLAAIIHRKLSGDNHPTSSMAVEALASLPLKFFGSLQAHKDAFRFRVLRPEAEVAYPQYLQSLIPTYNKQGFKAPDLTPNDLQKLELIPEKFPKIFEARRTVDEIVDDCINFVIASTEAAIPPSGSYFAVTLSSEASNGIVSFLETKFPERSIPNNWNIIANHVTLIHSTNYLENRHTWHSLFDLIGIPVLIKPVSYLLTDKLATVRVEISKTNNEPLNEHVQSKIPHVTVATAPGQSSFGSVAALGTTPSSAEVVIAPEEIHILEGILNFTDPSEVEEH